MPKNKYATRRAVDPLRFQINKTIIKINYLLSNKDVCCRVERGTHAMEACLITTMVSTQIDELLPPPFIEKTGYGSRMLMWYKVCGVCVYAMQHHTTPYNTIHTPNITAHTQHHTHPTSQTPPTSIHSTPRHGVPPPFGTSVSPCRTPCTKTRTRIADMA